ncbi:MAG: prepilin-type N-terminal cleavage/methylation domain-containing protein [Puniceicoccales bacterium]
MLTNHQRPNGFTLLEVLLALGLFAIASAALVQSASDALRAYDVVRTDSEREQMYRYLLRSIVSIEERDEMEDGGDLRLPDDTRADWEAEIEDGEMVDLFRVLITIELESDRFSSGDEEVRTFEVLLFRPDWQMEDGEGILDDRRKAMEDRRRGI